ncbi:HD domain-containing phosphohydrolase [Sulfurimonas sp.]|uniref:HD domain-containing phosphohydrolase n=1 Tax=Sulfurimonas sp. TaxID=2022749 RepID=UPI003D1296F8
MNQKTILVVDDAPDNLMLLSNLLKQKYKVKVANSGEKALKVISSDQRPDLILLDILMPHMDGYETLRRIKEDEATRDIPIIFLTALSDAEDEKHGLGLGASDYVTKPISPAIMMARIKTQLENKAAADFLKNQNSFLDAEVQKRTEEISAIQEVTISALASLAETRDSDTGNHIKRTQHYVKLLAQHLQKNPKFAPFLDDAMIKTLFMSAPLHDIGKVGIPDSILLKPGRFTPEEFEIMKTHTTLGAEAIARAEEDLGFEVKFLKIAKEITLYHQEKFDGSGYPEGLKGEQIPLSARIMAVADVYDALISKRVYKEPVSHEKGVAIMREGRGTHFDPDIFDAFLEIQDTFLEVALRYADAEDELQKKKEHLSLFARE